MNVDIQNTKLWEDGILYIKSLILEAKELALDIKKEETLGLKLQENN
jgi:hypothetical protein